MAVWIAIKNQINAQKYYKVLCMLFVWIINSCLYFSVFFTFCTLSLNWDKPHIYSYPTYSNSWISVWPIRCTTYPWCSRHPQQTGVFCSGSHCPQSELAGAPLWERHPGLLCSLPAAQWRWLSPARSTQSICFPLHLCEKELRFCYISRVQTVSNRDVTEINVRHKHHKCMSWILVYGNSW